MIPPLADNISLSMYNDKFASFTSHGLDLISSNTSSPLSSLNNSISAIIPSPPFKKTCLGLVTVSLMEV